MRLIAEKKVMTTDQYLAALYSIVKKLSGAIAAKEAVSDTMYLVICEIHDEGLEVTPELINTKIAAHIEEIIEVAKKTNVA